MLGRRFKMTSNNEICGCGHGEYLHDFKGRPCKIKNCKCKKFTPQKSNSADTKNSEIRLNRNVSRSGNNKIDDEITHIKIRQNKTEPRNNIIGYFNKGIELF